MLVQRLAGALDPVAGRRQQAVRVAATKLVCGTAQRCQGVARYGWPTPVGIGTNQVPGTGGVPQARKDNGVEGFVAKFCVS